MSDGGRYDFLDEIGNCSHGEAQATYQVLLRICTNVVTQPNELKYRRLRISSKVMQNKILPVDGAFNCLLAMGFQEDGEYLTLPQKSPLDELTAIKDQLHKLLDDKPSNENYTASHSTDASTESVHLQTSQQTLPDINFPSLSTNENSSLNESVFYSSLVSTIKNVRRYEDPDLLQKARRIIPVDKLKKSAKLKFDMLKNSQDEINNFGVDDCLLIGLLDWYKKSFFKWVDNPACTFCQCVEVQRKGTDIPLPEEARWLTQNVELYSCTLCDTVIRFPRYNHPGKLLETREGRCGEWANCFTLCCRAMGFEARFVVSWKDHVWTEVFSTFQDRWLHCDPCENVCDKPLLYELGWGVKIDYIIAFSVDEIQDVTSRYTCKPDEVKHNRTKVRETWLIATMENLRTILQQNLSPERKDKLSLRQMKELVEMMSPKSADSKGLSGRTTGSLAWRLGRGEIENHVPYVFKPDNKEKDAKSLCVNYSCSKDVYIRPNAQNKEMKEWMSGAFSVNDIIRKEEHDWKMVYLARQEGTETASISWKFDVSDCHMTIKQLEIFPNSNTFSTGKIIWDVHGDICDTCTLEAGEKSVLDRVKGCRWIILTAKLSGGEGDCAWQHTQLFRQKFQETEFPLQIAVYLENE